jgi:peptidoglycan hydrolase-like protein with peptidoglycan-binding domain
LGVGSQGSDVAALQAYLAADPSIYPQGTVSGYFGSLTRAAVQRFQEKYGIAKAGDPGYGIVGPKTRAKIRELTSVGATLSPAAQPATQEALIQSIQQQILLLQEQIKKLQGQ